MLIVNKILIFLLCTSINSFSAIDPESEPLVTPKPIPNTIVEVDDDFLLRTADNASTGSHTSSIELERKIQDSNTNKLVCYSGLVSGAVSGGVTFLLWILFTKVWDKTL